MSKDKEPKMGLISYLIWRYEYRKFSAEDHFALYDNACQAVRFLESSHPSYIMAQRYMLFHGRLAKSETKKNKKTAGV